MVKPAKGGQGREPERRERGGPGRQGGIGLLLRVRVGRRHHRGRQWPEDMEDRGKPSEARHWQ